MQKSERFWQAFHYNIQQRHKSIELICGCYVAENTCKAGNLKFGILWQNHNAIPNICLLPAFRPFGLRNEQRGKFTVKFQYGKGKLQLFSDCQFNE